jgi:hypothetical protein
MPAASLTRRTLLALPLALAACGEGEDTRSYAPLRYDYLPPIPLNVATIDIEQRFVPSGVAPDASQLAPVPPVEALRAMAQDRLKAFGTTGRAVFAIQDASLIRRGDTITGSMAVILTIYPEGGPPAGYAEARVGRQVSGRTGSLRQTLYDMVHTMMDQMNVEFEYQLRRNLRDWITTSTSVPTPVEQAPLDGSSAGTAPSAPAPSTTPAPPPQSMAPPPGELAAPTQPAPDLSSPFPQTGTPPSAYPPASPPGSYFPPAGYPPAVSPPGGAPPSAFPSSIYPPGYPAAPYPAVPSRPAP